MRAIQSFVFVAALSLVSGSAVAGADDLTSCTIESTTEGDRANLVRWMFAAVSRHPVVAPLANVSAEQLEEASESMGKLFVRLMTRDCAELARKAIKSEGTLAIRRSMQALGELAGRELFAQPEVATALSGLEQYARDPALMALVDGSE